MRSLASMLLLALTLLAAPTVGLCELPLTLTSPDGTLVLSFATSQTAPLTYSLSTAGRNLIKPSSIACDGGKFSSASRRAVSTVWRPLWGKRALVPDQFNELALDMTTCRVIARAYNNGIAFRTLGPAAGQTQFAFAGDYTAWFYNGERPNIGPERLSASNGPRHPVITIKVDDTCYLAIHEADLQNGQPLDLKAAAGTMTFTVASQPTEAWRVILFGRSPGDLVDSHLIELLNPPPASDLDFSWVKPGIGVWDWRINGAKVDGFSYTMSYPSWVRMVDFAAENGISYLVLDADWYGKEFARESNPTKGGYAADARMLIDYARQKDVGIWLYINDVAGRNYPIDQTLKVYHEWGAVGIKYGFMIGSPEEKNARTRMITELCARSHLLCDFHDGPVHPYGQMRTWPNALTREYCHSQLDARRVFQPGTFTTAVFVNMLAGPLDMNNGLADLTQAGRRDNGSPVPSTLAGEAARTLIVFSGATIIPDIPENYRKHPEILQFISAEQMPWQESKTLSGAIGEYIVMARQSRTGTWLIGAATNESPRTLDVPLTFLPPGHYQALIIQDGEDSDYRTHRESYRATRQTLTPADTLHLTLAPGGGACVTLTQSP